MQALLLLFFAYLVANNSYAAGANVDDSSGGLFLTPYLERGDIEMGRALSRVGRLPGLRRNVPSYSGFFTVNKAHNSNIFFWFFPAMNKKVTAPLLLWLQGGPGASGLIGLFVENGPYIVLPNNTVRLRKHTWNREFHVLYVDSPVGAGFSFTDSDKGYATTQDQVTEDLYVFLQQFFQMFYEYGRNDFYITGESYGGKHGPYLAHKLHTTGTPANVNLKGLAIGNGFIDVHILKDFDQYLFQLGLVDSKQASAVKGQFDLMEHHLQNKEYIQGLQQLNKFLPFLFDPDVAATDSNLTSVTGFEFFYNYLQIKQPEDYSFFRTYIDGQQARSALHVGNRIFRDDHTVKHFLNVDTLVSSSRNKIAQLLDHYKVLVYCGQLDLSFPYSLTEQNLLMNITWGRSGDYRNAERKIWRVSEDVAGYAREGGNLVGVLVRNAGHLVPREQPGFALDMITRFIKDIPFE